MFVSYACCSLFYVGAYCLLAPLLQLQPKAGWWKQCASSLPKVPSVQERSAGFGKGCVYTHRLLSLSTTVDLLEHDSVLEETNLMLYSINETTSGSKMRCDVMRSHY